jgi:uncharacterized Zn finger protein (UPF0148 family)
VNRTDLPSQHFAADTRGCPACGYELIPHPDGKRFVCPKCRYERATMQSEAPPRPARPAIAAVLKVMTETLEHIHTEGGKVDSDPSIDASDAPAETPWISVIELGHRWHVSTYIATHRLREHAVPSLRELGGKLVVDRKDVAAWPDEAPPAIRAGSGSGNGHASETPKAEPPPEPSPPVTANIDVFVGGEHPRGLLPSQEYQLIMQGAEARVRRLRRALTTIADVANRDNHYLLLTIKVLAEYVLEVER